MLKNFNFLNLTEFKKFLTILEAKEKKNLFFVFLLMVIASLLEMISIGIVFPLINFLFNPDVKSNGIFNSNVKYFEDFATVDYINLVLILIFVVYSLKVLFTFFYTYFNTKVILDLKSNITSKLFKTYLKENYLFHLNKNSALLIRNIQQETSELINSFLSPLLTFALSLMTTFFIILLLFYYSFLSSLIVVFIFGFLGFLLNAFVRDKLKMIGEKRQVHQYGMLKNLQQGLSLIKEIKLTSKESFFLEKFNFHNTALIPHGIKRAIYGNMPKLMFEYLFILIFIFVIFYLNQTKTPFEEFFPIFTIYALASFRIIPGLSNLSRAYQKIKVALPALQLVVNEMTEKEKLNDENQTNIINQSMKFNESLDLKEISFKYSEKQEFVLDKLNLKIKKNSIIGIIGDNAAGKSTLLNLICGLTKPTTGKILIDGKNIFDNLNSWQKSIGLIPQSIYLIDGNVKNNIALGVLEKDIDNEKIEGLMKLTGLAETINQGDLVGERGKNISGGQKQKIGIARALYVEPKILILDEATSAMDVDSEENLTETIFNKSNVKTLIIITHRQKILKYCDYIYKLENKNISLIEKTEIAKNII